MEVVAVARGSEMVALVVMEESRSPSQSSVRSRLTATR